QPFTIRAEMRRNNFVPMGQRESRSQTSIKIPDPHSRTGSSEYTLAIGSKFDPPDHLIVLEGRPNWPSRVCLPNFNRLVCRSGYHREPIGTELSEEDRISVFKWHRADPAGGCIPNTTSVTGRC